MGSRFYPDAPRSSAVMESPAANAAAFDESFVVLHRIEAVVLIYGNGRRLYADEHNHSARLMRTLDAIGKEGLPLRAVFRGRQVLDRSSLRALALYLHHGNGLEAFRRATPNGWRHRLAWRDLEERLNLRWTY